MSVPGRFLVAPLAALLLCGVPARATAQQCAAGTAGCSAPRDSGVAHVDPNDDAVVVTPLAIARGRAIFHGQGGCFVCHGAALEGGIGPTLRAHKWKDAGDGSRAAIQAVIDHGVPGTAMVAHPGGIDETAVNYVAAYVWAVSHDHAKP